jgi:hypothetical protein
MKTTLALLFTFALLAANLFAGDELIKQRAKDLVNQNNVRQGIGAPVQPTPPPAAATPGAAAPKQSPALAKLKTDLAALKTATAATAQQKQQLSADLIAVTGGAAKPTAATAAKWAEDVSAGFMDQALSPGSLTRFLTEIDAVLNPDKYPQARMDAIFTDVQAIFQANGLIRRNAVKISDDMKVLAGEVRAR